MKKYHNTKETKKVGKQIRKLREEKNLSIGDIAQMTGFAHSTISSIENGGESDTSHLVEIAKAIGEHPMEMFNVSIDLKPRFKLDPNRQDRNLFTSRIRKIYEETDFFDTPKFVSEVVEYLKETYSIKAESSRTSISTVLKRLCKDNMLKYSKVGRRNLYVRKRRKKKL